MLSDSGISGLGATITTANLSIDAKLKAKSIDPNNNKLGIKVFKALENKHVEAKWLTYNK
jgi:hypothetical protein